MVQISLEFNVTNVDPAHIRMFLANMDIEKLEYSIPSGGATADETLFA